jgi:hypothetical protein
MSRVWPSCDEGAALAPFGKTWPADSASAIGGWRSDIERTFRGNRAISVRVYVGHRVRSLRIFVPIHAMMHRNPYRMNRYKDMGPGPLALSTETIPPSNSTISTTTILKNISVPTVSSHPQIGLKKISRVVPKPQSSNRINLIIPPCLTIPSRRVRFMFTSNQRRRFSPTKPSRKHM